MALNSKGRIITDAFIVKPLVLRKGQIVASADGVWIEAFAEHTDELLAHIKKHSFRKHVLIDDISHSIDTLLVYVLAV